MAVADPSGFDPAVEGEIAGRVRSEWMLAWTRFRRNKAALVGGIVLIIIALAAIFADVITPYGLRDFANPITVIEDPLDAVQLVAPYTVVTHIKDMHARPMTQVGEPRFFHAPIGSGDVPIEAILEILQSEAPDPDNLEHCLEIVPTSEFDPEAWLNASLDWLRANCAKFWN